VAANSKGTAPPRRSAPGTVHHQNATLVQARQEPHLQTISDVVSTGDTRVGMHAASYGLQTFTNMEAASVAAGALPVPTIEGTHAASHMNEISQTAVLASEVVHASTPTAEIAHAPTTTAATTHACDSLVSLRGCLHA
jgi:hypothetical protein